MNLFVYGSLRPGASRYELIERWVRAEVEAHIEGRLFVMPDGNPILIEGGDATTVRGNLLYLPDSPVVLRDFDAVEGVADPSSPYLRVQRLVQAQAGDEQAFVYVCKSDETYRVLADGVEIPEGDWFLRE